LLEFILWLLFLSGVLWLIFNDVSAHIIFGVFVVGSLGLIFLLVDFEEAIEKYHNTELYSLNGSQFTTKVSFSLGSGVIDSKEVYLAEMKKDEGLVRKYIPVKDTIKFIDENLTYKAILQERLCIYRDWMHQAIDKEHICKNRGNKKVILRVPPGTIIQRFKL